MKLTFLGFWGSVAGSVYSKNVLVGSSATEPSAAGIADTSCAVRVELFESLSLSLGRTSSFNGLPDVLDSVAMKFRSFAPTGAILAKVTRMRVRLRVELIVGL